MSPRIAALLCAMLLLSGYTNTAYAALTPWTADEIAYLDALNQPLPTLRDALKDVLHADNFGRAIKNAEALLDQMMGVPAPATLAVIDYYRAEVHTRCYSALEDSTALNLAQYLAPCLSLVDALRLELARLYAARGAYPPGYQP